MILGLHVTAVNFRHIAKAELCIVVATDEQLFEFVGIFEESGRTERDELGADLYPSGIHHDISLPELPDNCL